MDGQPQKLGGSRPRVVLAVLLLHSGQVVPASRLIDEVWAEDPPETAANVLQGYVSQLRKALGRDAIETREPGYLLRWITTHSISIASSDSRRTARSSSSAGGRRTGRCSWESACALARASARRRRRRGSLGSRGRRASTSCGLWRSNDASRLTSLVDATRISSASSKRLPRSTRFASDPRACRCSPSTDVVDRLTRSPRTARRAERLSTSSESSRARPLQELERKILGHDASLDLAPGRVRDERMAHARSCSCPLELESMDGLVALAEPLVRVGDQRELVLASTVDGRIDAAGASSR